MYINILYYIKMLLRYSCYFCLKINVLNKNDLNIFIYSSQIKLNFNSVTLKGF